MLPGQLRGLPFTENHYRRLPDDKDCLDAGIGESTQAPITRALTWRHAHVWPEPRAYKVQPNTSNVAGDDGRSPTKRRKQS